MFPSPSPHEWADAARLVQSTGHFLGRPRSEQVAGWAERLAHRRLTQISAEDLAVVLSGGPLTSRVFLQERGQNAAAKHVTPAASVPFPESCRGSASQAKRNGCFMRKGGSQSPQKVLV